MGMPRVGNHGWADGVEATDPRRVGTEGPDMQHRIAGIVTAALVATLLVGGPGAEHVPPAAAAGAAPLIPVGAAPAGATSILDGNATTTERLVEDDPVHAALAVSRMRFVDHVAAGRRASHVVLSRDDLFADSLVGAALTDTGPLLLTGQKVLLEVVATELDRVLAPLGTVYLLGGPAALDPAVEDAVRNAGFIPRRLAGETRVETALEVADEVRSRHPDRDEVMLARAFGDGTAAWADAIAAGGLAAAAGVPIVVTHTDRLDAPVRAWLDADAPALTVVLGGPAAIAEPTIVGVPNPERVWGDDRQGTAADLARRGWGVSETGARRAVVIDARETDAWGVGLAAAGLAADVRVPILTLTTDVADTVRPLVRTCGPAEVDVAVIGSGRFVSGSLRERLDLLDGDACGPDGEIERDPNLRRGAACGHPSPRYEVEALERVTPYGLDTYHASGPVFAREDDFAEGAPVAAPPAPEADGGVEPVTESGTNTQEAGVDEPDVVKVRGDLVLSVIDNTLRAMDLSGATPVLRDSLALEGSGHELLVVGDVALVFTRNPAYAPSPRASDAAYFGWYTPLTTITRVDVSDPSDLTVTGSLEVEGDYRSARMVDGIARLVIASQPTQLPFTHPQDSTREAEQAALDHNVQVIRDATAADWLPVATRRDAAGTVLSQTLAVDCADVEQPPQFSGFGTMTVLTIDVAGSLEPTDSTAITAAGETIYASANQLVITSTRWTDYEQDRVGTAIQTELHVFDITESATASYAASGRVDGTILSSYSLSEHGGFLRVATTDQPAWFGQGDADAQDNQVIVLQQDGDALIEVGRVDGLGEGEQIRGVRFFGDTAAVVTFLQIDPLYLIDLSVPEAPVATGELKITGFSAYLHLLDADRLIGVGQEADEDGRTISPKTSLFDISDPERPTEADVHQEADPGSFLVQHETRAFQRIRATDQLVLPLSTFSQTGRGQFRGVVVLDIDGDDLTEAGRFQHPLRDGDMAAAQIERSFVVDGVLHTLSWAGLDSRSLATLSGGTFLSFPNG